MATYYRWNKYEAVYRRNQSPGSDRRGASYVLPGAYDSYEVGYGLSFNEQTGEFALSTVEESGNVSDGGFEITISGGKCIIFHTNEEIMLNDYHGLAIYMRSSSSGSINVRLSDQNNRVHTSFESGSSTSPDIAYYYYDLSSWPWYGDLLGYVYSLDSSSYPSIGVDSSGDYYYSGRTTVESPTAPSGLNTPNPITTPSITVSWSAATSNVPDYPVNLYELSYSVNGGSSWTVAGTTAGTSLEVDIPAGTTSIQFRVRARDSNGQWGSYSTSSTAIPVYLAPTLTVPQMLMQGQQATINWTAITGADSYTLQRKANTDSDWTQVYSGAALTFSETVGTWTTVQYRVQAVFDGTPGGWATSAEIPVVSASALVISGQDGDLGTLVNDVPYSISTDTGNQITATITVNGAVIFSGNVGNSTAGVIPVLDLINGAGTIVIEASVTASSGPVSAVRTWTYTKTMMTFPNAGSIAELTKDGKVMWPETLAEAVRIPGGKTLDQVMGFPCQVYAGSYVGTGTFGESNPNELAFPFEPKFVTIIPASQFTMGNAYGLIWTGQPGSPDINNNAFILDGKTLKWYAESAAYQCNSHGMTFYYAALG